MNTLLMAIAAADIISYLAAGGKQSNQMLLGEKQLEQEMLVWVCLQGRLKWVPLWVSFSPLPGVQKHGSGLWGSSSVRSERT